jgi:HlyD family secretion protein
VLVVDSNVKKVQHPTGGVVGELHARDGLRVKAGDLLVRLDDTITRANRAIIVKSLDELDARQARLKAERDDQLKIAFSPSLSDRADSVGISELIGEEQKLFDIRTNARAGQKAQLRERVGQLTEEIQGLVTQAEAKAKEIELIRQELVGVRELREKNLIPITRLITLEREAVRIEGERGQLLAASAQTKGKITETGLQILQIDQDLKSEVAKELREIQGKTIELVERRVAAEDQLKRTDIRSPQDGFVHQLSVHTIGGVVSPSEQLMLIVPGADDLFVELKIPPQNIDQVALEQTAILRFSTFNQRTTPELSGRITAIGADVTQDPKTGVSYYLARAAIAPSEIEKLKGLKLIPGMPVEAFIQMTERTVMSFLVKPLSDQILKAFRER